MNIVRSGVNGRYCHYDPHYIDVSLRGRGDALLTVVVVRNHCHDRSVVERLAPVIFH